VDGGDYQRGSSECCADRQKPRTSGLTNELTHRPPPEAHRNVPTVIARGLPDADDAP
jgi:hypothetical protein